MPPVIVYSKLNAPIRPDPNWVQPEPPAPGRPIQTYLHLPIVPQRADGITPQTTPPEHAQTLAPSAAAAAPTTTMTPPTATSTTSTTYPSARPGPAPPQPTGSARPTYHQQAPASTPTAAPTASPYAPTQTAPPPPQPGAVPSPYPHTSSGPQRAAPPPPKAGELPRRSPPPTQPHYMPPQMAMEPPQPAPSHTARGTAAAAAATAPMLINTPSQANIAHPPGYHQNATAAEFSSHQRTAHEQDALSGVFADGENHDGGIWDQAKKLAKGAGESLAAADREFWNKVGNGK